MQTALPLAEISRSSSSSSAGHPDLAPPSTNDPVMQAALIADIFRMRMVLPPDVETTQHDAAGEMGTQTCCSRIAASQMQLQLLQLQIQEGDGPQWQEVELKDIMTTKSWLPCLYRLFSSTMNFCPCVFRTTMLRRGCAPKLASCSSQQLLAGSAD